MVIHSTIEYSKLGPKVTGPVNICHLLCVVRKLFNSRKFGSILRFCLLFIILIFVYITSSYVLSSSEEETSIEDISNETGFSDIPSILKQVIPTKLSKPVVPNEVVFLPPAMKYGEMLPNCGLSKACADGEFSIHIYTGKDHRDEPRLCVDSKYILSKDVNGAGRGINAVIVDNVTKSIVKINHFDTYEKESTAFETLLLTLRPGDIIILLTFDEPTRKLSRVAKLLLFELGSSLIQNLSYRGSWYLVTQKGISGFSPYEALHIVDKTGWPKHHDVHFCAPFQIKGEAVHPDPLPRINQQRVEFCQKFGDYPLFCDADVINDPLNAAALIKRSTAVGRIYNTPIVITTGENISYLPVMLETLLKQSGNNPSFVVVFYLPQNFQVPKLCDLFGFMSVELSQSYSYCERVKEAVETASLLFPESKEILLLGENLILAPDFLYYMGQLLPLLQMDSTIISVSAFNENGFQNTRENLTMNYRVESFTGVATLVRKDFFHKNWCSNDSESDPLYITTEIKGDSIVPEVSRVLLIPQNFNDDYNVALWSSLLSHKRSVSYEDSVILVGLEKLIGSNYNNNLNKLLTSAKSIPIKVLKEDICTSAPHSDVNESFQWQTVFNGSTVGDVYAIYLNQVNDADMAGFQLICQCFGLLYHPPYSPRGLYRGVLRFSFAGNEILAVGSSSPFYHNKPPGVQLLTVSNSLNEI